MKPPKGTFPHVVTTPREVSGSYHRQCAEQRPRTLWSTCGPLRTQADPGGPGRFHRSLERVLFRGLKSPRFLESDFKKRGGFTPDDDRLNARCLALDLVRPLALDVRPLLAAKWTFARIRTSAKCRWY